AVEEVMGKAVASPKRKKRSKLPERVAGVVAQGIVILALGWALWLMLIGNPDPDGIEAKRLPPPEDSGERPFVLLAKDGRTEQACLTLKDAVARARSGDTMEVRGDGPFVVGPIGLGNKALCVRAGAGARPVLVLSSAQTAGRLRAVVNFRSCLVLEGL